MILFKAEVDQRPKRRLYKYIYRSCAYFQLVSLFGACAPSHICSEWSLPSAFGIGSQSVQVSLKNPGNQKADWTWNSMDTYFTTLNGQARQACLIYSVTRPLLASHLQRLPAPNTIPPTTATPRKPKTSPMPSSLVQRRPFGRFLVSSKKQTELPKPNHKVEEMLFGNSGLPRGAELPWHAMAGGGGSQIGIGP